MPPPISKTIAVHISPGLLYELKQIPDPNQAYETTMTLRGKTVNAVSTPALDHQAIFAKSLAWGGLGAIATGAVLNSKLVAGLGAFAIFIGWQLNSKVYDQRRALSRFVQLCNEAKKAN